MEKTPESDRKETRKIQVNLRILKKFSHSDRVKHYVNDYILRKKMAEECVFFWEH